MSNYIQVTYDGSINLTIYVHQNTPFGPLSSQHKLALSQDNVEKLYKCLGKIVKGESCSIAMAYNL